MGKAQKLGGAQAGERPIVPVLANPPLKGGCTGLRAGHRDAQAAVYHLSRLHVDCKAGITVRMCQNYARIRTITVRKCQNYSRIRVRTKLSEYAPNVLKPGLFALFLLFSNFFLNSNFVRTSESELRQNGRMPAKLANPELHAA